MMKLYRKNPHKIAAPTMTFVNNFDTDNFEDEEMIELSETTATILKSQTINDTTPGSILCDFQVLINAIGADGIVSSGKYCLIPAKLLEDINQQLSKPIKITLQRVQQKSYPPIHGLYLLLRATGIVSAVGQGKTQKLILNAEILHSWQQLNPTERYCTLLEAWMLHTHQEILGDRRGSASDGNMVVRLWPLIMTKQHLSFPSYRDQDRISHAFGDHNLALLEMFGILQIETGKTEAGKGWRMKSIDVLPWGDAIMELLHNAEFVTSANLFSCPNVADGFNNLQPLLSPYFPLWQQTLMVPTMPFRSGRHIFKVTLGKCWRRIAIAGDATLWDFSRLILDSVDFDSDHLDMFTYKNLRGHKIEVFHPYAQEAPTTDEVTIGSLPLEIDSAMEYLFDFGDNWRFKILLEEIEHMPDLAGITQDNKEIESSAKKKKSRKKLANQWRGEVLETQGKAPEQYPDYGDEY